MLEIEHRSGEEYQPENKLYPQDLWGMKKRFFMVVLYTYLRITNRDDQVFEIHHVYHNPNNAQQTIEKTREWWFNNSINSWLSQHDEAISCHWLHGIKQEKHNHSLLYHGTMRNLSSTSLVPIQHLPLTALILDTNYDQSPTIETM